MNKIQKLIVSMKVVIHLWKMGFYFSKNDHYDKTFETTDTEHWGFYRLNWNKDGIDKFSILDIDFASDKHDNKTKYFHMHTDYTLLRVDFDEKNEVEKVR